MSTNKDIFSNIKSRLFNNKFYTEIRQVLSCEHVKRKKHLRNELWQGTHIGIYLAI